MPVIAFATLWLAASTPATPVTDDGGQPPAPAAGVQPDVRNQLKTGKSPASATKKGPDNDEPGCEE